MPKPGTDFKNILDFKAVNPPTGPKAPQSIIANDITVPSPYVTLS